ncbi:hypothetical protein BBBOND_0104460 [Babesia bigemina]|uniref:Uncharacterized protein n=1 Tax=Babesia bigemina TaxID=5866 RepID=A0A061D1Y7_BABBI|nr:hypothetical protein BBBOND_0104460 [Babesia bigemina]CDR94137.1 hypothetical protein BBBOND_0104460 [Babesia bigemina]|eukprot:XP_012766323.1 hypothetical protein BBBOND_0104460 [Babesia bigemina]
MVYTSLTDIPRNLKEGIDWLLAVKGADAEKNLAAMGAALYDFLVDKPVGFTEVPALENVKLISKEFLERQEFKDMWPANELLGRFNNHVKTQNIDHLKYPFPINDSDFSNVVRARRAVPEKIAEDLGRIVDGCESFLEHIVLPEQYLSAYNSEATWKKSCSEKPEDCAVVLVGIAPMLYAGLRSLKVACDNERLGGVPGAKAMSSLGSVLLADGYQEKQWPTAMTPSYVAKALEGVSHEVLVTLYDFAGFWAFYGLHDPNNVPAVKSGELDKDAQEFIDFYVNMKPINPPKKKLQFIKSPSTYTATGSNNMYYPWLPTVLDMGDTVPL